MTQSIITFVLLFFTENNGLHSAITLPYSPEKKFVLVFYIVNKLLNNNIYHILLAVKINQ